MNKKFIIKLLVIFLGLNNFLATINASQQTAPTLDDAIFSLALSASGTPELNNFINAVTKGSGIQESLNKLKTKVPDFSDADEQLVLKASAKDILQAFENIDKTILNPEQTEALKKMGGTMQEASSAESSDGGGSSGGLSDTVKGFLIGLGPEALTIFLAAVYAIRNNYKSKLNQKNQGEISDAKGPKVLLDFLKIAEFLRDEKIAGAKQLDNLIQQIKDGNTTKAWDTLVKLTKDNIPDRLFSKAQKQQLEKLTPKIAEKAFQQKVSEVNDFIKQGEFKKATDLLTDFENQKITESQKVNIELIKSQITQAQENYLENKKKISEIQTQITENPDQALDDLGKLKSLTIDQSKLVATMKEQIINAQNVEAISNIQQLISNKKNLDALIKIEELEKNKPNEKSQKLIASLKSSVSDNLFKEIQEDFKNLKTNQNHQEILDKINKLEPYFKNNTNYEELTKIKKRIETNQKIEFGKIKQDLQKMKSPIDRLQRINDMLKDKRFSENQKNRLSDSYSPDISSIKREYGADYQEKLNQFEQLKQDVIQSKTTFDKLKLQPKTPLLTLQQARENLEQSASQLQLKHKALELQPVAMRAQLEMLYPGKTTMHSEILGSLPIKTLTPTEVELMHPLV